jgi:hypothetical protein
VSAQTVQQIPAEDFGPIIDGHAWWIVDHPVKRKHPGDLIVQSLDRPCDTCGGSGWRSLATAIGRVPCLACGSTGRHTFTVELDGWHDRDSSANVGAIRDNPEHRLSIVPGAILPIVEDESEWDGSLPAIVLYLSGFWPIPRSLGEAATKLGLPSGARPDRWAVQCKVAS